MNNTIGLEQAVKMTSLLRQHRARISGPGTVAKPLIPISETYDRAAFDKLLSHPECKKVRIYYGMNNDLQLRAVIVGVNERDEDILPASDTLKTTEGSNEGDDGTIIEDSLTCPPVCPTTSPLNPSNP
jgi:hypothetical protein